MAGLRFDFSGCRVLVTGGTSGIGHGVAKAFADAGAHVTVTGRRAARGEYDVDLSRFDYRQAQMLDPDSLTSLIASIDRLDVLVNNAGESMLARNEWDPAVFRDALQLHLGSGFQLAVGLKPLLAKSRIEGGGSVLSCTSMSALRSSTLVPGYGAAKAGLVQMTLNAAVAWARDNVRVNSVAPGLILTRMTARMQQPDMAEVEKSELAKIPMARWGTPEDVAPAFLFLASPAARYITGQTLCVDGGYSVF
jgi:NAD(P)-dependent dehydrogenase (short-subunit alcohol dehydrogenase family)